MNPRAFALVKTLKAFQAVMLAVTLVTLSFPVTPLTARAQEDTTPTEEVVVEEATTPEEQAPEESTQEGENTLNLDVVLDTQNNNVDICHKPGTPAAQVLNVNSNAVSGHTGHGDYVIDAQHPASGCVATEEPKDPPYTYDDETEDDMCVVVSDTYTIEGGQPAVLVSNPHSAWTAVLASISKWIWGEDPTTLTAGDEVETFTRTFSVDEVPSGATLRVAADNGYSVTVNGHAVGADPEEHNYQAGHEDNYSIPAADLLEGENAITFVVTNKDLSGETPANNPGGLRYVLTVNGADCGEPKTPENSCVAPSTLETTGTQTFGGSEETLQHILDNATPSYSVDADDDQTNTQQWNGTGNNVDFTFKYVKGIAANKHVFGYFLNGGAFQPIFKDGNVTGYAATPTAVVGSTYNLSLTNVSDVVFAIYDGTSYYYTKNTSNGDGKRHAVVYNSDNNEYVVAFEDLPNQGDKDFNDLVVEIGVTGCETPEDSITVVATKIVCDDESDLPNVMGSNHQTTADTAADFLETHGDSCHLEEGWQFQWCDQNDGDAGRAFTGEAAGYTTSGLTAEDGTVSMTIPLEGITEVHLREVLKPGYIPFSFDQTGGDNSNVSAEFACSNDGLNYDNWDFIRSPEEGKTYYCVAWNVEKEKAPTCDPKINLVANGGFENPDVTNGAGWDVFEVGTSPALVWLADFVGAASGGKVEIHGGVNGWLASEGSQYTELDSDLNGPSNPGGQSAVEIAQGLTTVNGQKYHVSYDFSARPGTAKEQNGVTVSVNGVPMQTTNAANATAGNQTEWDSYGFDFTAGGTLTTLALRDAGNANDSLGSFVDNVTVTCVPDEQGEDTAETLVVTPFASQGWSLFNYDIADGSDDANPTTSGTDGDFVTGPATPPLQTGSFNQKVVNGDDATRLMSSDYNGTPLEDITKLEYSTYVTANAGAQATYIQIRIDRDADGTWDDALFFEPVYQSGTYGMLAYSPDAVPDQCDGNPNCVAIGAWQDWDADAGGWWSNNDSAGGPPLTTLADYAAEYPGAVLATDVPAIRIQTGFGGAAWQNFDGNFDKFVIAVKTGSNTHTTTYDFEPAEDDGCFDDERDVRVDCGGDDEGRLVIIKEVDGEDASFDFDIVAGEFFADADVTTTGRSGSTELYLSEGTYDVTESVFEGYSLDSVTCEYEGESEGVNIVNGERIYIEEGETVTCTFHNTQDEQFDGPTSRSGSGRGRSGGSSGDGEVLGASTCGPLLTDYLKMGWANSPDEVTKLQQFLNDQLGVTLPLSGFFGPMTFDAVKAFQLAHAKDILIPWVGLPGSGITGENTPTGFVYQTTRWQINNIWCPGS
ncbi:MAG TPA: DUF642 domain-containing protein, partial [Candidatus Paceibacterota bacterium]|nr:DUF642 domain-containing protein [Candidatus Paceibacterota bacterium]